MLWDLSGQAGLFPFRQATLALLVCLPIILYWYSPIATDVGSVLQKTLRFLQPAQNEIT